MGDGSQTPESCPTHADRWDSSCDVCIEIARRRGSRSAAIARLQSIGEDPYIDPPEPADHVVIYPASDGHPAFTWGDHRQMLRWLEEAEESDPKVKAARERLDEALIRSGWKDDKGNVVQICKECHRPVNKPHEEECSFRPARPEEIPVRDAHGYKYLDENFIEMHITSAPCNDEEALDYFRIVKNFRYTTAPRVKYIYKRSLGEHVYKMMPYWYDYETGKVWHFNERKPSLPGS